MQTYIPQTRFDNPAVVEGARALHAADRRDELTAAAYRSLRSELIDTLVRDPSATVMAPGFQNDYSAAEVVHDMFSDKGGDELLHELLRIVGMASAGKVTFDLHLRAAAWLAAAGSKYANYHCAILADEMIGDEE